MGNNTAGQIQAILNDNGYSNATVTHEDSEHRTGIQKVAAYGLDESDIELICKNINYEIGSATIDQNIYTAQESLNNGVALVLHLPEHQENLERVFTAIESAVAKTVHEKANGHSECVPSDTHREGPSSGHTIG